MTATRRPHRPCADQKRLGAACAHGNQALALHQPYHARAIRWQSAMDDTHTGQAVTSAGPTEQLANNAFATRCSTAAQTDPVERRVDRGCHEVIFLPLD